VHYVYLLQSLSHPNQRYIGLTSDLKARLAKHNAGGVPHTSKFTPWKLGTYVAFSTREQASQFELYLKSGSGRAFASRHLWPEMPDSPPIPAGPGPNSCCVGQRI
jgi:predicted GIY-YIG superfamily endonuclease